MQATPAATSASTRTQAVASSETRFSFADAIRGIAAMWVVVFHLWAGGHINGLLSHVPDAVSSGVFHLGHLGVAVFFVLSGFVMGLNVRSRRADANFAGRFVARRFARLTPPYYFAIAFCIGYVLLRNLVSDDPPDLPGAGSLAAHLLYLQGLLHYPDISSVFWTLCIEVQFYIFFALLLHAVDASGGTVNPSRRAWLIFATAMAGLAWTLGWTDFGGKGWFFGYWYSFAAGVLVCWGWRERGLPVTLAVAYCVGLGVVSAVSRDPFAITAAVTAVVMLGVCLAGGMGRWLDWRPLQFLGLISYSLYLIHNNVIGAAFFTTRAVLSPGLAQEFIGAVLALSATLFTCWLMYLFVEKPAIGWSRRISTRPAGVAKASPVAT